MSLSQAIDIISKNPVMVDQVNKLFMGCDEENLREFLIEFAEASLEV